MNKLSTEEIKVIIEDFYQKGKIEDWKNKNFQDLSFDVQQKTKILVSSSTLKRIFGKLKTSSKYNPQEATIKALETFALSQQVSSDKMPTFKKPIINKWTIFISVAIILFTGIVVLFNNNNKNIDTLITLDKIEGYNTATAYFNLTGNSHKHTKLRLHFGDGKDTITLKKNKTSLVHFYKYPGAFYPQLLEDNKVIKTFEKIIVPTKGWIALGTGQNLSRDNKVFPISQKIIQKPEGYWHLTTSDMAKCGMDTTRVNLMRLYNFQNYNIDGDNFELSLRVKNAVFWPQTNCNSIVIKIVCENGLVKQYFSKPGCSIWVIGQYSEVFKSSDKYNMSDFCVDLSDWGDLHISNQDKVIDFKLNDSLVKTETYKKPLGNIIGVEVSFFGTGYMDNIVLSSPDSSQVYSQDFTAITL